MSMDSMPTGQVLGGLPRGKHVLPAHWTIILVLVLHTVVIIVNIHTNTHATLMTMSKGFTPPYTAETTVIAMKGFLGFHHPQVADTAMVLSKLDATSYAIVRCRLSRVAFLANDFADSESVHGPMSRGGCHLIMADPAPEYLATARGDYIALPFVVHTAHGLVWETMRCGRSDRTGGYDPRPRRYCRGFPPVRG
mmetsp:Transcript_19114/g.38775  ORF Transcript_19114/g.38775 Transcript_19114/m.38775 type:complete len:194 (-) Transcript_19114:171-752(-)